MYSQHCFIAVNSEPKLLISIVVCFLENQWTRAVCVYSKNPVLDLLVIISAAWSTSTLVQTMNPSPLSCGMLGGSSCLIITYPNADNIQSCFWNSDSFISRSFESKLTLCYGNFQDMKIYEKVVPSDPLLALSYVRHDPIQLSVLGCLSVTYSMMS